MEPIIETEHLVKRFNAQSILSFPDIQVLQGEFIGIIGSSGAGKSTLLNIIGLLDDHFEGTLLVKDKKNPKGRVALQLLRYDFAYLFQNYALMNNKTVKENLRIAMAYQRKVDKEKQISKALKTVGLEGFESRKILNLSGGEQQRVALARVLVKDSSIILADEPTGNLDQTNARIVIETLEELHRKGKTIIMVTHSLDLLTYCDRVMELKRS